MSFATETRKRKLNALSMVHLNGDLLCAFDTSTTGKDHDLDEIIEIVAIPLDSALKFHTQKNLKLFQMFVRPSNAKSAQEAGIGEEKWRTVQAYGVDASVAADKFYDWFQKLELPQDKRIIPLCHNWSFDSFMLRKLFGHKTFDLMFSSNCRDPMLIASFMNDYHEMSTSSAIARHPFTKYGLNNIAQALKLSKPLVKTTLSDAILTVEVYRALLALGAEYRSGNEELMPSPKLDGTDT